MKTLVVKQSEALAILDSNPQILLNREFGKDTENLDALKGAQPFLDAEMTAQVKSFASDATNTIEGPAQKRRRNGGHGREPFPDHLLRNRMPCDPPESERIRSCCSKSLVRIGEEIRGAGHDIPARFVVNQYVRGKWACSDGHDGVRCVPAPAGLIDRTKYEVSMYAHTSPRHVYRPFTIALAA